MCVFFFNDTSTTEIYTLSLHDALPISRCPARVLGSASGAHHQLGRDAARVDARWGRLHARAHRPAAHLRVAHQPRRVDRKSTRLNSSHTVISYAVFYM